MNPQTNATAARRRTAIAALVGAILAVAITLAMTHPFTHPAARAAAATRASSSAADLDVWAAAAAERASTSQPNWQPDPSRVGAWDLFAKSARLDISSLTTPQALRLVDCTGGATGGRLLSPWEISRSSDPNLTPRTRDLAIAAWFLCD